jgi:hypothetical protein
MSHARWICVSTAFAITLLLGGTAAADDAKARRAGDIAWKHVRVLADDKLEGRNAGSPGHRRAAEYVAAQFKKAGLTPGGDEGFLQAVPLEVRQINEEKSSLTLTINGQKRALKLGDDAAIFLRGNFVRETEAPLVFVGHGLRLPEYGVDDLAGVDLKGKVVVAFNSAPTRVPGAVGAHFGSTAERWKIYRAAGAVGTIFLPNPFSMDLPWPRVMQARLDPFMVLRGLGDEFEGQQLWAIFNPTRLEILLEGTPHKAPDILALLKDGQSMPHFDLAAKISSVVDVNVSTVTSENVVGILPGSDPVLKDEYVVLSAHLDHLGVKKEGEGDRIYNGALDNAAGISVLIEAAKALGKDQRRGKAPKRSILFAAVTAEEKGLLGSRANVAKAKQSGKRLVANLNSDMFLPLYPFKHVVVFGLEESDLAQDARAVAADLGIEVQTDPQPLRNRFIRSDQYSYIREGVPSLATKIGVLPDSPEAEIERKWQQERYHAVGDDLHQPVDIEALGAYLDFAQRLAVRVANREQKPKWFGTSVFSR